MPQHGMIHQTAENHLLPHTAHRTTMQHNMSGGHTPCTAPHCHTLCHTMPLHATIHHCTPHHPPPTMPCHAMPHAMPLHATPHSTTCHTLCHVTPHYVPRLVINRGNPGVFLPYLYPYLAKPVPMATGMGLARFSAF